MHAPEWTEFRLHLDPEVAYPRHKPATGEQAHQWAATLVERFADDPRCRLPVDLVYPQGSKALGLTGRSLSPIRWVADQTSVSITAVGDEAVDLLRSNAHRLTRICTQEARRPFRETWTSGSMGWSVRPSPTRYRVHQFVFERRVAAKHRLADPGAKVTATAEVIRALEARILTGLYRQAAFLGLQEPPEEPMVRVESVGNITGWRRDGVHYGLVAHDVLFGTDLFLRGPWAVGSLCLLGCGAVLSPRQTGRLRLAA